MRIGVLAAVQHSMFSSGATNTSLAVAELMREFGHEVEFIQFAGDKTWWDDCRALGAQWKVVTINDAKNYDLVFEVDRMNLPTEVRARISRKSVWIVRKPFLLQELELGLFPTTMTLKREFAGLSEVWLMDTAAAMEEGSIQALELLSNVPVRIVPFVWSPSPAATHLQESNIGSWLDSTVAELKNLHPEGKIVPPWSVHIAETNTTNASSATLPLVILREAKRRGLNIGRWKLHNTEVISTSKFFLENIVKNCCDPEVGLSGELVGRQRSVEWARKPMSLVLSHLRFSIIRPLLLDVAWAGIPLVHNSPLLREIGLGLERSYYSDNHVGEACDAIHRVQSDLVNLHGIFAQDNLKNIRAHLLADFSPLSATVKEGWGATLKALTGATPAAPAKEEKTLRVGFSDMWENFNPAYNFFVLMLSAAGEKLSPPVKVVGGVADATSNIVIFGPFGSAWKSLPAEQPKIHFTGENSPPLDGPGVQLNLGFGHYDMVGEDYLRFPLWILEIDWFGADSTKIVNPKPIPLERCTKVFSNEIARKKKFCAFVVSNPSNPVRNAAFQWLSEYKQVDSAGRLFNNVGGDIFAGLGGGGGELLKHEFLKDYKFCLAYENNAARGYTTEKLLHAKAAGCIPIYWGDEAVERDFSTGGFIDARKFKSPEELIDAVRRVDTDDSEWLKRFSVPALDPYRVAWCHRTMAECARRMFLLGGFVSESFPETIGDVTVTVAPVAPVAPVAAAPLAVRGTVEPPIMVTCATRKYLPSLQQWLVSISTHMKADDSIRAIVFTASDVPEDSLKALKEKFTFATFEKLPDTQPPANSFPDFWEPQHFGWKLWILNELCGRPELAGRMIFYTDAGVFVCRWPKDWMLKAQAAGLCLLEDPRQENRRWCSPEFCAVLKPTEAELAAQQRLGGLVIFRAGEKLPSTVFSESLALGRRREVLVGPKWAGMDSSGKPTGHRHDQSIMTIVSMRHGVPVHPLDTVYCDTSLRKTFTSGRSLYVHRGNFQVHKQFSDKIDEAFVINLERRGDRLDRLWSNCPELKERVERWQAIDGRALKMTPAIKRLLKPNDFFWKKAVTGCALSHLGLWWKLANEHPDIENYLILEDDAKLRPGWEAQWKAAVDDIPEDYDIIYLGGVLPPNREMFEGAGKQRVNDSFCRIADNKMWGQTTPTRYFHFCAYAYVLSRRGAEKIMELLEAHDGYWTSADHILCNPVTVLRSYVLDPMVAGCYQDDDPKYATSQFNDFSRVDGFDSDLWNNNERFTDDTTFSTECEGELNIEQALKDAREVAGVAAAPAAAPAAPVAAPLAPVKHDLPVRFVALDKQKLDISQLHECSWLHYLFGKPKMFVIDPISLTSPPPTDSPIVILQRPHTDQLTAMLEKWDSYGAKFRILHLSDEHLNDNISAYSLPSCERVFRFYLRPDCTSDKITTLPLGFHWTLLEGSKNMLTVTPRLPFRSLTWSFFGTDWNNRRTLLEPLMQQKHEAQFFDNWNSPNAAPQEKYISTLLGTVFVPCPDGVNPETFRFYEALECGCLPIVVRTEKNVAWVDWVCENLQLLPLSNWSEAAKLMEHLMGNKELLEGYRNKVLSSWIRWREQLRTEMKEWLDTLV